MPNNTNHPAGEQADIIFKALSSLIHEGYVTKDELQTITHVGTVAGTKRKIPLNQIIPKTIEKAPNVTEELALSALLAAQKEINPSREYYVIATDASPFADATKLISVEQARARHVLPVSIEESTRTVTIIAPLTEVWDITFEDTIRNRNTNLGAEYQFKILLSSKKELQTAINNSYKLDQELRAIEEKGGNQSAQALRTPAQVEVLAERSLAEDFVEKTLESAVTDGASDIHFDPGVNSLMVRLRQDGILRYVTEDTSKNLALEIISYIKIRASLDIAEKRKPQDGRFTYNHPKKGAVDFRVAIIPTVSGEKAVLRVLDNSAANKGLKDLGFSTHNLTRFKDSCSRTSGIILVTGPTGSGKSTTLYAALKSLSKPEINIITVEDPVEYRIPRINQIQVNNKTGNTFAKALRTILRADPDVILVGEIRDAETAQIAIEAAQTGHLVLSTLHTNDAPSAYTRLIELGLDKYLVASVTESVIAQRLARRLCTNCRVPYTPTETRLAALSRFPHTPGTPLPTIYEANPEGCKQCVGMGYKGRMGLHEVLTKTPALEEVILDGAKTPAIREQALRDGMTTLIEDGWGKVLAGETSIEEILRVAA